MNSNTLRGTPGGNAQHPDSASHGSISKGLSSGMGGGAGAADMAFINSSGPRVSPIQEISDHLDHVIGTMAELVQRQDNFRDRMRGNSSDSPSKDQGATRSYSGALGELEERACRLKALAERALASQVHDIDNLV